MAESFQERFRGLGDSGRTIQHPASPFATSVSRSARIVRVPAHDARSRPRRACRESSRGSPSSRFGDHAKEQPLPLPARRRATPEQPGGDDARVVPHEHIAGRKQHSPLRRGEELELHPEDGARYDVREGERVRVSSRRGSVIAPVRFDPGLRPGLVFMTMHFPDEVDTNLLTLDATDPKSGTAEFKAAALEVEDGERITTIRTRLLAGYHDGYIELFYPRVFKYQIQSPSCVRGLGDWLYDEFTLSPDGHVIHEIEWAGLPDCEGSRWIIEASDIEFQWVPK